MTQCLKSQAKIDATSRVMASSCAAAPTHNPPSMKHPLTQKRFSHRRSLVFAKPSIVRKGSRQSTLTQLDFVSTPPAKQDSDISCSDEDDLASVQPKKRRKTGAASSARRNATLTQIGFVNPGQGDEADIIGDSQPASEAELSPQQDDTGHIVSTSPMTRSMATGETTLGPGKQDHGNNSATVTSSPVADQPEVTTTITTKIAALASSPLPVIKSSAPTTPKTTRKLELPSSQTPLSVALSPHREPQSSSPLLERSTNISAGRKIRLLKRISTVQDSQFEDGTQQDSEDEDDLNERTATLAEQYTYDPADSALDRDAARFAMTQMGGRLYVMDTHSDDEIDLVDQAAAATTTDDNQEPEPPPALRPSQISTVMLTQSSPPYQRRTSQSSMIAQNSTTRSSPPPLVFTSVTKEPQDTIVIPSSPSLPQPQWGGSIGSKNSAVNTISDFSLPPPPPLEWGSSQFSLRRNNS